MSALDEDSRDENQEDNGDSLGIGSFGNNRGGRKKSSLRKGISSIFDNIKGAIKGDIKEIAKLKGKLIILGVIIVLVVAALFVEGVVKSTSKIATDSVATTFANSTSPAATEFNTTGSLILASEDELKEINDNFMKSIENKSKSYYDSFTTKYYGKTSSSVAKKIKHITTNYDSGEVAELNSVTNSVPNVSGAVSLSDERTIFEHILRAEKYNFNSIVWRSFVKNGTTLKEDSITLQVDPSSKLKYPASDTNNLDNASHDLNFFITKTRSYLQSWYIPFDFAVGLEGQSSNEFNTKLAYEIMASAYHEIVMDRYKVETLTRKTQYLNYDKKVTTKKTTRECGLYQIPNGENGRIMKLYCVDKTTTDVVETADIRESVLVSSDAANTKYRWAYVVSQAKLLDNVISNEYDFKPFYNYSTNNYNSYINKTGSYKNMSIDEYEESEKSNSKADSFSHTSEDYYKKETVEKIEAATINWLPDDTYELVDQLPENATYHSGRKTKVVKWTEEIEKEGKKYEDIYVWQDQLNFTATKSGIYNVDSVKDVTGDDLSSTDQTYYENLYNSQEINLIDIMNSDKNIYLNYMSTEDMSSETDNIGIRKDELDLSYHALKSDLTDILEKYSLNGIRYGSSLGIDINSFTTLSGLNFSNMENIAAGNMEGMNVAYPIATEELGNAYLQVAKKFGNSYGYEGHGGVDISYAYAAADKSLCSDYSNSVCPYIKGPGIYTVMDGVIKQVGYCPYNTHYDVGINEGKYTDGNLKVNSGTGWGSYVKVENVDGSAVIYAHLFPDRDFLKKLSDSIGQSVSAGTFIGYMGNTGSSTGLHLHIEFGQSVSTLGGGRTSNSSLTYVYLMKIINTMGISPTIV